jgi:hypothetical protein
MLNKQSISAISALRDVSDSIIFNYPITGIRNAGGTIFAFVDVEKLGTEEFDEFGVIKFRELVDLINVAGQDANVALNEGIINIVGKNVKCRYFTTDVRVLEESFRASLKMLEKTSEATAAMEFTLLSSELQQLKKVSGLLNVEDLTIIGKNGKVSMKAENASQQSSNGFTLDSETGVVTAEASVILGINNFKKLPDGDYKVKVAVNGSNFITRFDSLSIDGLVICIATKAL